MKRKLLLIALCALFIPTAALADIQVYADNGDFIGIFLGMESNSTIIVYNPTMELFLPIYTGHSINAGYEGTLRGEKLYYTTGGCTSTPYLLGNTHYNSLFVTHDGYYSSSDSLYSLTMNSYQGATDSSCTPDTNARQGRVATKYTESLPFTYPIQFPLTFKVKNPAVVIPLP